MSLFKVRELFGRFLHKTIEEEFVNAKDWNEDRYIFDPQFTGDPLYFVNGGFDIPEGPAGADIESVDVSGGVSDGEQPYKFYIDVYPDGWDEEDFEIGEENGIITGTRPETALAATKAVISVVDGSNNYRSITINVGAVKTTETAYTTPGDVNNDGHQYARHPADLSVFPRQNHRLFILTVQAG